MAADPIGGRNEKSSKILKMLTDSVLSDEFKGKYYISLLLDDIQYYLICGILDRNYTQLNNAL